MFMKTKLNLIQIGLLLLALPTTVQAQFSFTTNNGTITITGYTGSGGAVTIPDTINGLPVTSIGDYAFWTNSTVTSVSIGNSVTSIGLAAFYECPNLTSVSMGTNVTLISRYAFLNCHNLTNLNIPNSVTYIGVNAFASCSLTSITIPNNVTYLGSGAFLECTSLTNAIIGTNITSINEATFAYCYGLTRIIIPNSVNNIGDSAYYYCSYLTRVTIGNSVTNIGNHAFDFCFNLRSICFQGNAPATVGVLAFFSSHTVAYYLPGTTGWTQFAHIAFLPTMLWNPQVQNDSSFGVQANQFGFNITGSSNLVLVVEACTNFANPVWQPVGTNTLNTIIGTKGSSYFSDPQWTNYPARFYRIRTP